MYDIHDLPFLIYNPALMQDHQLVYLAGDFAIRSAHLHAIDIDATPYPVVVIILAVPFNSR